MTIDMSRSALHRSRRSEDESGMVAGGEALAFGVLVFVFGTLILVNGWAVVDAKFAASAAAREAVRAVVQAPAGSSPAELREHADGAARQSLVAHGYDAEAVRVQPTASTTLSLERCRQIELEAVIEVRSALVPGLQGPSVFRVSARHTEVVDPFRSGLPEGVDCGF